MSKSKKTVTRPQLWKLVHNGGRLMSVYLVENWGKGPGYGVLHFNNQPLVNVMDLIRERIQIKYGKSFKFASMDSSSDKDLHKLKEWEILDDRY